MLGLCLPLPLAFAMLILQLTLLANVADINRVVIALGICVLVGQRRILPGLSRIEHAQQTRAAEPVGDKLKNNEQRTK